MQTTISLPRNLAQEVEKQVKKGTFRTPSEFINAAIKTLLSLQEGELTWETPRKSFSDLCKAKNLQRWIFFKR